MRTTAADAERNVLRGLRANERLLLSGHVAPNVRERDAVLHHQRVVRVGVDRVLLHPVVVLAAERAELLDPLPDGIRSDA